MPNLKNGQNQSVPLIWLRMLLYIYSEEHFGTKIPCPSQTFNFATSPYFWKFPARVGGAYCSAKWEPFDRFQE